MLIVPSTALPSSAKVLEAQQHLVQSSQRFVLASHRDDVRLFRGSAIQSAIGMGQSSTRLNELPLWASSHCRMVGDWSPLTLRTAIQSYSMTPELSDFMSKIGNTFAVMPNLTGPYTLISGFESGIMMDYHCALNNHPFYPPPQWTEGITCWLCGSPVVRD